MKLSKSFIALTASILFYSCADQYEETARVISLPPFTTLQIKSVFSVYLVQDTVCAVRIVGDDDVVGHVDAKVEGSVLNLEDNNRGKWLNPTNNKINVYVHSPKHYQINAESSYSLYSINTITSDQLVIVNDGAVKLSEIDLTVDCNSIEYWNNFLAGGKLTLRGKCQTFNLNNYALHLIDTQDLSSHSGYISSYAKADSKIYVTDSLECDLHGTGNIYVYGNPAEIIVKERTSSGQVLRAN